jgi:hypothetical protein
MARCQTAGAKDAGFARKPSLAQVDTVARILYDARGSGRPGGGCYDGNQEGRSVLAIFESLTRERNHAIEPR